MFNMKPLCLIVGAGILASSSIVFAASSNPFANNSFYIALDAGLFQGSFDQNYNDQTDIIPQNVSESVPQHGYTTGLAVGYSKLLAQQYLLGAELSGNLDFQSANYANGSSSLAFSDSTKIKNHVDLVLVPGILLNSTTAAYVKLGISSASMQDTVNSPVGYTPVYTNYSTNKNAIGFAGALGIKKFVNDDVSIFAEGNYHDYGNVNFNQFQNFSATYSHSAHVYSYGLVLGAAYNF